jgi:tetratricopeptide (TPR) repeat protein
MEADPYRAFSLLQQSVRDFAETQIMHMWSFALTVEGAALVWLGRGSEAEDSARRGLSLAEKIRDDYQIANARFYLGHVLVDRLDPGSLEEAERLERAVLDSNVSRAYNAVAQMTLANIAIARGDWVRAEAEGRLGYEYSATTPPYLIMCAAHLIRSLLGQGRALEAAAAARENLLRLAEIGSTGFSEVPLRVAAAEALYAAGDIEAGREALREALRQIELRAAGIPDAPWRERHLTGRPENIRAFELARVWSV